MTQLVEKILEAEPAGAGGGLLFERSPVATLVFAANGAVVLANAAAHRLLRCPPGELMGRSAAMYFPELWRDGSRVSVDVSDEDPPRRVIARCHDGTTFAARLRLLQLESAGDLQFIATVEDLTEFHRELAERTAAVTATNKEFENFIDVAAHDLRAPLRILTDFTDALEDECAAMLNDEGRTFLKEILNAGHRMEGIIDGLLGLARSARCEMACESLDLTTLVELVYYELRHAGAERAVECTVDPGITGWGDVRLIMTVLRNLLGNAWKFTQRTESAEIRFRTEERGGRLWYCVTDNGAGFDMAHAGRLFKPFTRLHRQDEFPGHGIGLATVHRILKRHDGEIEAESVPGKGTTVRFTLGPKPD